MLVLLVSSQLSRSEQSSSHIFKESSKHLQSLPIASFSFSRLVKHLSHLSISFRALSVSYFGLSVCFITR